MAAPFSFPWPFPWPGKKDKPEVDLDLDPVVLIPGIGGSILNAVSDNGKKERIWVRLLNADHEFRTKLWSKFNPETGKTESLDKKTYIEVPQDNYGLYAVDTLDPDLKIPLDMVNYYHNMMLEMRKWGYQDGANLFGFGFDFRQSNRLPETMDALKTKLETLHEETGKKITVITHSMGGLLFKSFLALHPDVVAAHVGTWISIAAPFRGAPGFIIDTLLTGVEFLKGWQKDLFIAKWSMHQLLVECPSIYELMTEYEFEWKEPPELRIVRAGDGNNGAEGEVEVEKMDSAHKVISLLHEALKDNSINVNGETVPIPLSKSIVEWARKTRLLWKSAKIPEGVKFFNIYGTSLDTPYHCTYGSQKTPISELQEILHCEAEFDNVDGDGTVPAESAKADGLDAVYRIGVPGEHRALLRDARVFQLVKYFLGVAELDPMYDPVSDFVIIPTKDEVEEEMATETVVPTLIEDVFVAGKDEAGAEMNETSTETDEIDVLKDEENLDVDVLVERDSCTVERVARSDGLTGETISKTVSEVHVTIHMHLRLQASMNGSSGEASFQNGLGSVLALANPIADTLAKSNMSMESNDANESTKSKKSNSSLESFESFEAVDSVNSVDSLDSLKSLSFIEPIVTSMESNESNVANAPDDSDKSIDSMATNVEANGVKIAAIREACGLGLAAAMDRPSRPTSVLHAGVIRKKELVGSGVGLSAAC